MKNDKLYANICCYIHFSERYKVSLILGRQIELIAAHHLIHRKRSPFPYQGKA